MDLQADLSVLPVFRKRKPAMVPEDSLVLFILEVICRQSRDPHQFSHPPVKILPTTGRRLLTGFGRCIIPEVPLVKAQVQAIRVIMVAAGCREQ
jgi:hypothetical protein